MSNRLRLLPEQLWGDAPLLEDRSPHRRKITVDSACCTFTVLRAYGTLRLQLTYALLHSRIDKTPPTDTLVSPTLLVNKQHTPM
jgi:hypothetical protein